MKVFKIALLALFLIVGSFEAGTCKVIDETKSGIAVNAEDIPNRPMRDDANLKAIQKAFDNSNPRANVKRFPYDSGITYKIRLREFMGCAVVLPEGEEILSYTLFDKNNFAFTPLSDKISSLTNIFDVYAKYHGADTNLVVHGKSGNIYSFYLRVDSVDSTFMPNLVTYIEDPAITRAMQEKRAAKKEIEKLSAALKEEQKEKNPKSQEQGGEKDNDYLKSLPTKIDPERLDFAYIFRGGNKKIKPIRVFDDGYFTFFQFGQDNMDKVRNLPTVYRVVDGYDTPVNTRISGGCIVAETVNDKWTLRSGETHYCIWKEK